MTQIDMIRKYNYGGNAMKKLFCLIVCICLVVQTLCFCVSAEIRTDISAAASGTALELSSRSVCLMEASTGEILYEQNADEKLEPASVTKIMSLLLVMEAIDNKELTLETQISGSPHSSSMGGSQIWLEATETMPLNEMLKAIVVSSANDCTVAVAEHIAGSEETFVGKMNEKAKELGMKNTSFSNCTGLPTQNHYTTARDIAIMTRELLTHPKILEYTCIWTDTVRGGEMGLSNTNKLISFYNGANGMKTGFTSSALYCLSATAKRGDMQLIAATMKAPTSDKRFNDAKKLLDYGFANFSLYTPKACELNDIPVTGGIKDMVSLGANTPNILLQKGNEKKIKCETVLEKSLKAPVSKGQTAGYISYSLDGKEISRTPIVTLENIRRVNFFDIFKKMLTKSVSLR